MKIQRIPLQILAISLMLLLISFVHGLEETTTQAPANVTESSSLPTDATTPTPYSSDDNNTTGTESNVEDDGKSNESDKATAEHGTNDDNQNDDNKDSSNNGEELQEQPQQPKVYIIHHHYNNGPQGAGSPSAIGQPPLQPIPVDNLPPEYQDPNFPFGSRLQQQQQPQPQQQPQQPNPYQSPNQQTDQQQQQPPMAETTAETFDEDMARFDPLGQYNDQQKKRQFFQDLLHNQLSKFESEIEPMIEKEDNITSKNDMEDLLGMVRDLKRSIENHQIFNITQLMDDWKEGRLQPPSSSSSSSNQPHHHHHHHPHHHRLSSKQSPPPLPPPGMMPNMIHHYHPRFASQWMPQPPSISELPINQVPVSHSEMTLNIRPPTTRTFLLVPQSRMVQPEFAPQFHPGGNGYPPGFYPPTFHQQQQRSNFYSSDSMMTPMMPMMFNRRSSSSPSSTAAAAASSAPIPKFYTPQELQNKYPLKSGVQYTLARSVDGQQHSNDDDRGNEYDIDTSNNNNNDNDDNKTIDVIDGDNQSNTNNQKQSNTSASSSSASNLFDPEYDYQK